jgi:putative inorganic carbon (HCO3(-)) transporter
MEIIFEEFSLQLAILCFIALFILSVKQNRSLFVSYLPAMLLFYLVKIYIHPFFWLEKLRFFLKNNDFSVFKEIVNSLFTLPERNKAVFRADFSKFEGWAIPTNLLEILLLILLIFNFKIILQTLKNFFIDKHKNLLLISISGFFLASFLSSFWAINHANALGVVKSWVLIPLLIFLLIFPLLKSQKFQNKLFFGLVYFGAINALSSLPFLLKNILTYDFRLSGLFLSPNHLAMVLVPGIFILILALFKFRSFFGQTALLFLILLSSVELYFTYSYTAWLAMISTLIFFLVVLTLKSKNAELKKRGRNILLFLISVCLLLFLSELNNPKLASIIHGDYYSSFNSRIMIWESALLISKDHLLLGIGGGNFGQVYLDYQKYFSEPYEEWAVPEPHNIFLAFHLSLGLLGLISFFLLVVLYLIRIFNFLTTTENLSFSGLSGKVVRTETLLMLFASLYLIYFLIHGLVDTPYWKNDLSLIFWLCIAIIFRFTRC